MVKKSEQIKKRYPHVIPDIEDWPIYKLHKDRRNFIQEIDTHTTQHFFKYDTSRLTDIIAKVIYLERIRIKEEPWKVDPPKERHFWRKTRQKLAASLDNSKEEVHQTNEEILKQIVHRYSEEIVGTFRIQTFLFARKFLTIFFTRLLNTAAGKNIHRLWGSRYRLSDRFIVKGFVEETRSLMKKGTIVVVPTHFSNLDSILIGYALDTFVGLPSFSYGAGLNLYNTGYTAYFMNRLGAYRVDRRKKNLIYLETLKGMSNLSLQRGTNSLFFPGGTRSRAGALETKLKLGLLSTVVEAQRSNFMRGDDTKIFVVPLVLGYHFVLEAQFLIEQHLKRSGKEHYIKEKDDFHSIRKILKFAWQFFAASNEIALSFGQPMDVLGNPVDAEGNSYDQYGNLIDVKSYFVSNGALKEDGQRESEYTRRLGEKIVARYHQDNIVLTSHLVAFTAFEMLKKLNAKLDLYGILRLPVDDYVFDVNLLSEGIRQMQKVLQEMEKEGKIKLSEQIYWKAEALIKDGIKRLGSYHVSKALKFNKEGEIISQSFKLLYFYHNRLENYDLDKKINWPTISLV